MRFWRITISWSEMGTTCRREMTVVEMSQVGAMARACEWKAFFGRSVEIESIEEVSYD